jgi:arylsulfatase A-like enzyme
VLLPWLVVAINALLARLDQILDSAVADTVAGAPDLSHRAIAYQLRYDLLLGFVVIPVLLLLLLGWARWRRVLLATTVLAVFWQILMSAEIATYAMANNYATLRTMCKGLLWAIQHPKHQFLTLPLFDKINVLSWMALVALVIALVTAIPRRRRLWWNRAGLILTALFAAVTPMTALARRAEGPRSSIYKDIAYSLVEHTDSEMMEKTIPELMATYREDSATPPVHDAAPYAAKAQGYNLVMVVMESMSGQVFDPAEDSLADMPNARRLRANAFVSPRHYTTFPLTNRASFGIFTSIYSRKSVGHALNDRPITLPSMIRDLDGAGYETAYYGFVWRDEDERDDSMLDALGFDHIVDPQEHAAELPAAELMFGGDVHGAAAKDHEALVDLRRDIRKWTAQNKMFAAAFFPEMGHDPWRSLTGHIPSSSLEAGHALAVYQDAFLGEIIDELRQDGALDRTIIVVTADHGERTIESPSGDEILISHGRLDDRTMRVPLLIYVPKVLERTVTLMGPTSHLDLAPTLLTLLGIEKQDELQQGTVMWAPETATRRLYLPMDVFGASGYYQQGTYYSDNQGVVYRSDRMRFTDSALPYDSDEASAVRSIVEKHSALQDALVDHLVNARQ